MNIREAINRDAGVVRIDALVENLTDRREAAREAVMRRDLGEQQTEFYRGVHTVCADLLRLLTTTDPETP